MRFLKSGDDEVLEEEEGGEGAIEFTVAVSRANPAQQDRLILGTVLHSTVQAQVEEIYYLPKIIPI